MFKSLALITTTILALNSNANTYIEGLKKLSWQELAQNYDVTFEGDQLFFGGHIISILNTCMHDETTLRTQKKIRIEEQDGDTFVYVGHDYLYRSIHSYRTMVDGDGTVDVPYTIQTRRLISVVENDDHFYRRLLFKKEFTVPNCQ